MKTVSLIIFGTSFLLGCPSSSPNGINPQKVLLPIWQQTEHIFYNKTGSQVTVILIEEGKLRTKDGRVVERPDGSGSTRGEDGIVRDYIINEAGEQEYVTREYKETPVVLGDGKCVFTPSYYNLKFEIQGRTVCDTLRHGSLDPEQSCSDEVNKIRNGKGWRNTENRGEGSFSYVEFYNIVSENHLFEAAKEPQQHNDSFTHSCKRLVPKGYKPWSERAGNSDGGIRTL